MQRPSRYLSVGMSLLAASLLSAGSMAAPSGYLPGSTLTLGAISNNFTLNSLAYNPAVGELLLREGEANRFGWLSSFGANNEFGDVQNFEGEINDLADQVDRDDLTLNEAADLVDRFNAILPAFGQDGYVKINAGGALPAFPAVFHFSQLPGNFFIDAGTELLISGQFIDAPVEVNVNGSSGSITTESSMYLKSGLNLRLGMGYAQTVFNRNEGFGKGQLILGIKTDVHRLALSKQVIQVQDVDDLAQTVEDDYRNNEMVSTNVSVNLGAIWKANFYQLGVTFNNLNEPEFEYGTIGEDCATYSGNSQANCFQAQSFASKGRLQAREVHTMYAYPTVDGSLWLKRNVMVGASLDLAAHEDFVGSDYQWLNFAAFYQPRFWALPGIRMGYRQNQVGTELASVSAGITLFRNANLDLEYGLNTTEYDGNSAPRTFGINFGFEEHF
mgnify:CR=1 FL=1